MIKNKDFIEIEFTGRVKGGEIFDSNIKEDLEKLHHNHEHQIEAKPIVICLGESMFLHGVEEFLVNKPEPDTPADYEVELSPEKAFGMRDSKLVQAIPMGVFNQNNLTPFPGAVFNFDGRMAKILAVSGGRIIADFNNPLAGKTLIYKIRVLKKIEDTNEKIKAFNRFLFKEELQFKISDKNLILEVQKPLVNFAELFRDKYKSIFGLELEIKEKEKLSQ